MKNKYFFSVIIATYNRAVLVQRALQSLMAQTESDWEAWIIDDGSTDDTQLVVSSFLSQKIHYFYQPNQGDAAAKNKGVELAKGNYVTFLDSDDYYEDTHLATRKEILIQHPEIDILHGGVKIIGEQYVPDVFREGELIHLSKCVIGATFFIKKSVFTALHGFETIRLGSDAKLLAKAEKSGYSIEKTHHPTYVYDRTGTDSITHNYNKNI
ncbi:MAG: glycosyltransferase family 2 protein [Bacteroidia bacterium]|nr:glycosyltransferase family 2 protein [Bacteroidia bacterium]